jgi:hypothetical protein
VQLSDGVPRQFVIEIAGQCLGENLVDLLRTHATSLPFDGNSFYEKAGRCQGTLLGCFSSVHAFLPFSQAASVAILLSALLVSDIRSVLGGCSRFSRCCYLISVLSSHLSITPTIVVRLFAGLKARASAKTRFHQMFEEVDEF